MTTLYLAAPNTLPPAKRTDNHLLLVRVVDPEDDALVTRLADRLSADTAFLWTSKNLVKHVLLALQQEEL